MTTPGELYTVSLTSDPVDENGNRPTYEVDRGEYERLLELGLVVNAPAAPSSADYFAQEIGEVLLDDLSAAHAALVAVVETAGTTAATPSKIIRRDASGRAQVADPNVAADIATKGYTDTGDAAAKARANHTGTQPSSTLSDLTETVQDIVGALIVAGTNTTVSYNDAAGTFTINSTGGTGGTTDAEIVRDTIGAALVAGSGIQITVNDAGDSITVASTAVLPTRQVIAGTGLTGGGDLSADRTLAVSYGTAAGTAAQGNDSRIVGAAPASGVEGIKTHDGSAGGGTRPTGYSRVRWVGGTARPTNMVTGDLWEHDA